MKNTYRYSVSISVLQCHRNKAAGLSDHVQRVEATQLLSYLHFPQSFDTQLTRRHNFNDNKLSAQLSLVGKLIEKLCRTRKCKSNK